jgi:hypothetical protein
MRQSAVDAAAEPGSDAKRARDIADAALCATAALLVYLLLGQQTFYKIDGHLYLAYVLDGERSYPRHFLYLPMVFAARDLGAHLGLTLYEAARALSAAGTAAGVFFLHLASRSLGLPRAKALGVTAVFAAMQHVVFFATVVEVHGPFTAFAGLAGLAAARLAARPTLSRAALVGAACALAFCAHSTGALLPAVLLPLVLLYPRRPWTAALRPALVAGAVMAAGIAASPLLARAVGVQFDLRHSGEFATDRAATNFHGWWRYGETLVNEWLLPMRPWSALLPAALLVPHVRAQAAWLLAAAAVYLAVTQMILGGEPEWGAYFLPFGWPLALLLSRLLSARPLALIAVCQLALAAIGVRQHDQPQATRAYAAALAHEAGGARIAILVADDLDLQALLLWLPAAERVPLFQLARLPAAHAAAAADRLREHVDRLLETGAAVFLSDGGRTRITAYPEATPSGPALAAMLAQDFAAQRLVLPGFAGIRLRPR